MYEEREVFELKTWGLEIIKVNYKISIDFSGMQRYSKSNQSSSAM